MKYLIILAAICVGAQAFSIFNDVADQWETYKLTHNKHYESEAEESFRMKIFMENSEEVARHNQLYEQGLVSYYLQVNEWSDMSHQEFTQTVNGYNLTKPKMEGLLGLNEDMSATLIPTTNVELPDTFDWRRYGAVTAAKNQGQCGSCWSFSATGALEAQHFLKTKQLVSLSEQNLMDCSVKYGNNGCHGGRMDTSFVYIKDNHGLDTERTYPYEAREDNCRYNSGNSGATDRGYMYTEAGNEEHLRYAVATIGPMAIIIDASRPSFQQYKGGVYDDPQCSANALNHAVLAIGYGRENNKDYWLVKNSWGEGWGDRGFGKMSRNKRNQCGIASDCTVPVV